MVSCKFEFVMRSTHLLFTPKKHSLLIWILKFICQAPFYVSFELSFFKCNHFMKNYEFSSLSLTIETFWQNIFSTNIFVFFSFSFFWRYFGVVCYAEGTRRHLLQSVSRTWSVYRLLLRHRSLASLQSLSDRRHASAWSDWISSDGSVQQPRHSSRKSSFWCINDLFTLINHFLYQLEFFFINWIDVNRKICFWDAKICSSKIFFYILW